MDANYDFEIKPKITEKEIQQELEKIRQMGREEMARLWRFAPPGHKYFNKNLPYWDVFTSRFKALGGITPELSKKLKLEIL